MPGLALANDLIRRDEDMHIDFACALFRHIRSPPTSSSILETVNEAVDVETEFAIDMLSMQGHDIPLQGLHQYISLVEEDAGNRRRSRSRGYDTALYPPK
ncbi:hypothetical protein D9611_006990 [Ephemerocybe angulata]|uniref:Uncharacterized protein n=1 Tax=Ephemerocybe angulata TaxID=980116 RepID=A0A8H5EVN2_9AGAR|nr:hypothetical protein D9611_006990 [Tulosesus angulatus]